MSTDIDVIDIAAGIAPGSARDQLRAERADIRKHAKGCQGALFAPSDDAGLTPAERYAVALWVARLDGSDALARLYRDGLIAEAGHDLVAQAETDPEAHPRLRRLLDHAALLTAEPARATPEHLAALAEVGLSTRAIVVLSQLIGYVSFQTRLVSGLNLLSAGD